MTERYEVTRDPRSPRYFKECDVARIAQNCLDDTDIPDFIIIAGVAKALGLARVWVPDKNLAMEQAGKTFRDDIDNLIIEATQDAMNELDSISVIGIYETGLESNQERWMKLLRKYEDKILGKIEEAIEIETVTMLDAFEQGAETLINWLVYKLMTLAAKLVGGNYFAKVFIQGALWVFEWFAGMLVSFTQGMSLDVDDVIRGNPKYLKCFQPGTEKDWRLNKKSGKQTDDDRKKKKSVKKRLPRKKKGKTAWRQKQAW